jgi:FixJ family two-component response regulator
MTQRALTVFAVDDDPSVLKGIERLLRSAGFNAQVFASAEAFLDGYDHDVTGCIILDLAMPGLDGLQLQQRLVERGGVLPIIFLTGRGDIPASVRAMKQGAADFLTKPVDDQELLAAVQQATQRCRMVQEERRELADIEERLATLTAREYEVLEQLLSGKLNKQIAATLGTVEKTIKVHRARIMHKMHAPSLATLIRLAERAGVATRSVGSDSPG